MMPETKENVINQSEFDVLLSKASFADLDIA